MRKLSLLTVALSAALVACGGSSGSASNPTDPNQPQGNGPQGPSEPPTFSVSISPDLSYSPPSLTVSAGSTVSWVWPSCDAYSYSPTGCVSHSVVFDDGSNLASVVQTSGTYSRTFTVAGTYNYHCGVHGTAMAGKIIVQ